MISGLSFADTRRFLWNSQRHTCCRAWKVHSNSVNSGNNSHKASLSSDQLSLMMTSGLPLPKTRYSEKDFNNANASVNVPICSSLVKTIPIGNATATECVQKIKTRMLCWYIFEDESTKISSDDSCIYNELLTIRKVSFYKYWINERKYEGISDIYHFTDTFFRLVYWFRQVKFAELNFIFSTMPL